MESSFNNIYFFCISLFLLKDVADERVMYSKSDSPELMTYDDSNDIVDKVFETLLLGYKIGL